MANSYENEFKVMVVELLNSGRKVKEVSQEYGLNDSMIRRWRREYKATSGCFSKKNELSDQEREIRSLKKELREITLERDILKKAVSIFSKNDR